MSSRFCHHLYVANSKAMELAGITKDTPDPPGGVIGRDENGEPNGLFMKTPQWVSLMLLFPCPLKKNW
jgi:predicted amidohydrolase YtcJ